MRHTNDAMRFLLVLWLTAMSFGLIGAHPAIADTPRVMLLRTPNGGIQPQAMMDTKGVLHLIYFRGDPNHGDLFYVHRTPGSNQFSSAIRVNSQPGQDDGRTFASPRRIRSTDAGQCGCCAMRAFADHTGVLYILYRSAGANIHRDTTLLVSADHGETFRSTDLQPWQIGACPMSSFSLTEGNSGVLGAWETASQVSYAHLSGMTKPSAIPAPSTGSRKYPTVASGTDGKTLLAWVEGAGWDRGGSLCWQVYSKDGIPTQNRGQASGVPAWSLISAVAGPDGSYLVIY